MIRYLSICSGIEATTVAWHSLGWVPLGFAEIDRFPSAVLAHHYPETPNLGDFTQIAGCELGSNVDLLVGGTPCQDFSVAGLGEGLAGDRGNLALEYLRLAYRLRARWLVWENVPGVLSTNGGRDFGSILGGMVKLGYGFAYRVLDAQYVRVDSHARAVPQRRRRVFVVGYLGDWRRAAAVLFERECLSGDSAPSRKARTGVAGTLAARAGGGGWPDGGDGRHEQLIAGTLLDNGKAAGTATTQDAKSGLLLAFGGNNTDGPIDVATACRAKGGSGHGDFESETFIAFDTTQITSRANRSNPYPCHPLAASAHAPALAFNIYPTHGQGAALEASATGLANAISANPPARTDRGTRIATGWGVRRLTPLECERLQGFPDGYTDIPWRGGRAADGPRYRALGNSMAVNCMRWIGQRIQIAEGI